MKRNMRVAKLGIVEMVCGCDSRVMKKNGLVRDERWMKKSGSPDKVKNDVVGKKNLANFPLGSN